MLALNTAYFIYKIEVLEMVVACQEIPIILHTLNAVRDLRKERVILDCPSH